MTHSLCENIVQAAALLLGDIDEQTLISRANSLSRLTDDLRISIWQGREKSVPQPVVVEAVSSSPWTVTAPDCPDPTTCPAKLIQPSLPIRPLPSRYADFTDAQWSEWSNGKTHIATRGKDFNGLPTRFRDVLYTHAAKIGKKARTNVRSTEVVFTFVDRVEEADKPQTA